MSQKEIRVAFKRVSEKRSEAAYFCDAVARVLKSYELTSKIKAVRSSETPHSIKSHLPNPHMTFIIRHHCHSQQEN